MSGRTLRSLGLGLVTTAGAGVMALSAMMNSAFAYGDTPPDPADPTIGLVMGGSGLPLPEYNLPGYVQAADELYIHPNFPDTSYPGPYADGLFTPEYPILSVPFSLNYPDATTGPLAGFPALSTSMGQGMLALENAIATDMAAGDASTVFGWSQSSTISSLVMQQLDPSGTPMPNDGLQFVLIGDPSAPNGGLLERFDGLNLPSLGLSFDGATPANSFPTDIYTLEYDGYADFPQYPINFLADLNALLGTIDIHGLYLNQGLVPPEPGPTAEQIANATLLQGSAALGTTDSLTNYYMIDQTPPLVTLLEGIPAIGKPLADLLGPDLTVLINLGYGSDNLGYSLPANVPTPFGLFPDVNPTTVFDELVTGAQQGLSTFAGDLQNLSLSSLVPTASSAVAAVPAALPTITDVVNGITSAAASLSALLLQTSDIGYAVLFNLPSYDITLFTDNIDNPLDAIGLPLAADTGLLTMAAGFEFELVEQAITAVSNDITALIP
ncbi:MAG: PE-PPE domain-containing protein [Mycobacterium sp.]|nr:PE-PPE domain-containing protein [Mycobacterium sp.]MBV8294889.1 PE-PPE domain-containing protein [Mycobacterium sp.]